MFRPRGCGPCLGSALQLQQDLALRVLPRCHELLHTLAAPWAALKGMGVQRAAYSGNVQISSAPPTSSQVSPISGKAPMCQDLSLPPYGPTSEQLLSEKFLIIQMA